MDRPLKLLLLEADAAQARRIECSLRQSGLAVSTRRVETREDFEHALEQQPDAVLADSALGACDGHAALDIVHALQPVTPVIAIGAAPPDGAALELMRAGAADYVARDRLAELAPALRRSVQAADAARSRRHAEGVLGLSERHCHRLFETSGDGIAILDGASGEVVQINARMVELSGCSRDALLGRKVGEGEQGKIVALMATAFAHLQQGDEARYKPFELPAANGENVEIEASARVYRIGGRRFVECRLRDISAPRRAEKALVQLRHELTTAQAERQEALDALDLARTQYSEQSLHDRVTGLFDRRYLELALPRAIAHATRRKWPCSLLLIEVDQFEECVERHGIAAGDALLRAVSASLRSAFRASDTLSRHAEDQFVVILPGSGPVVAHSIAERMRTRIHALELVLDGVALPAITLSIGVAPLGGNATSAQALMQAAHRALQRVKRAGRDQAQLSSDYVVLAAVPDLKLARTSQ